MTDQYLSSFAKVALISMIRIARLVISIRWQGKKKKIDKKPRPNEWVPFARIKKPELYRIAIHGDFSASGRKDKDRSWIQCHPPPLVARSIQLEPWAHLSIRFGYRSLNPGVNLVVTSLLSATVVISVGLESDLPPKVSVFANSLVIILSFQIWHV